MMHFWTIAATVRLDEPLAAHDMDGIIGTEVFFYLDARLFRKEKTSRALLYPKYMRSWPFSFTVLYFVGVLTLSFMLVLQGDVVSIATICAQMTFLIEKEAMVCS